MGRPPVVGVDGQGPLLPQDAGQGVRLGPAVQGDGGARLGLQQRPQQVPREVRGRGCGPGETADGLSSAVATTPPLLKL